MSQVQSESTRDQVMEARAQRAIAEAGMAQQTARGGLIRSAGDKVAPMFRMINPVRDYAWGSFTAFAELLGWPESSVPQAEIWMGTHPKAPSEIIPGTQSDTTVCLPELLAQRPELLGATLGSAGELPFLLKLLAVDQPLSIQCHPTAEQARQGFDRENAAGIATDAPERNYGDPHHKPELLVALTGFSALCGFRSPEQAALAVDQALQLLSDSSPSRALLQDIRHHAAGGEFLGALEIILSTRRQQSSAAANDLGEALQDGPALGTGPLGTELRDTLTQLTTHFTGDPGMLVALLLNRVDLLPGEAVFLQAGQLHCYFKGVGVEVMAASDNVLRGGLTPKHMDVDELLHCTDPNSLDVPLCPAEVTEEHDDAATLTWFRPPVQEFQLAKVDFHRAGQHYTSAEPAAAIAVCTAGEVQTELGMLRAGESLFLGAGEATTFSAEAPSQMFLATSSA